METKAFVQTKKANSSLLCLKCRKAGHIASNCPSHRWPSNEFTWFFSEERRRIDCGSPSEISRRELCKRCEDLDILQLLQEELPWKSASALNEAARAGTDKFQSLGKTGSIEFWNDCTLCLCLFALTPNPSSPNQDVLILPDWTMNRVAGETPTVNDLEGWHRFSKCLLITLSDSLGSMEFNTRVHRGDALCVVDEDDPNQSLAGRFISPGHLRIEMVKGWLSSCDELHSATCRPIWTQELPDLKLVDVETRRIVRPPVGSFDYLALSYVWGGVDQQSYRLGCSLRKLPQTIEDAIDLSRKLGKRYLWVDSLCIDQSDTTDQEQQIRTMKNIYSGAYVTIVALSGKSANSGLPWLKQSKDIFPQLWCRVKGKRLVGLMPTLSQQIWRTPWGQRAWTLQEALLTPRCLYISDHQLYFECNGMQCCESLNDTKSWAHHIRLESKPAYGGWLASKVGDGCLRTPIDQPSHRMERYGSKLTLYSYRSMTNQIDALSAFSGILQFLGTMYTKGFFVGLPIEDFQWGLLWCSQYTPTRRPGFPTWSWAGWHVGVWPAYPLDFQKPNEYPLHLRISRAVEGKFEQLFETCHVDRLPKDPVARAASLDPEGPNFDLLAHPQAEEAGYLFIEAIMLQFKPDFSKPIGNIYQSGQHLIFAFSLRGVSCGIRIIGVDPLVHEERRGERSQFLLLARDYHEDSGLVFHYLLLMDIKEGIALRKTVLELLIPVRRLDVLDDFRLQKTRVVMA